MAPSFKRNREAGALGYTSHYGETNTNEVQMGWFFENWRTRKGMVKKLTHGRRRTTPGGLVVRSMYLAQCCRGCIFSGVLWSVWEQTIKKNSVHVKPVKRWIRCDCLHYWTVCGWGVKYLAESMEPFVYSCPLSYLRMAPVVNERWRKRVREYHRRVKAKRAGLPGYSISISRCMRQRAIGSTFRKPRKAFRSKLSQEEYPNGS